MRSSEIQNRPYLSVTVVRNKNTDRYFDIVKIDDGIYWELTFEIENKGSTPANNISFPKMAKLKDNTTVDETAPLASDDIVLAQGEKYYQTISMGGSFANDIDIDTRLEKFKANDADLQLLFFVKYTGLLNPSKEFETRKNFNINSNEISIIEGSKFE